MDSPSAIQPTYPFRNEMTWSRSEKAIAAHKAFNAALRRDLHAVIQETQQMASRINEPAGLWELEHYLTLRRKQIDRKYQYKYSELAHVFGKLLQEGRLSEAELRGLREDKLKAIRSHAKFLAEIEAA